MHCKDVSVHDVGVPLTAENIDSLMTSWTSYIRTEVLVLRNGDEYATVKLDKDKGTGLFRKVIGYEILSLPNDTVYLQDDDIDVINVPAMASVQSMYPGKTIIVKGMFSHMNVIKDIDPVTVTVIDNIPPEPMKLSVLVRMALASGFVDRPVIAEDKAIDLTDRLPEVKTEAVMFPCKVSGLKADIPVFFLDEAPDLDRDVTLIGCHLSERIFKELYGKDVKLLNVCPADHTDGKMSIVKCCKIKEGFRIDGNVAKVPWGATVPEVAEALNALLS